MMALMQANQGKQLSKLLVGMIPLDSVANCMA